MHVSEKMKLTVLSDDGGVSDSVLALGSCENVDARFPKKTDKLGSEELQSEVIVLAAKNFVKRRYPVV